MARFKPTHLKSSLSFKRIEAIAGVGGGRRT
jgi:hypothetical protein